MAWIKATGKKLAITAIIAIRAFIPMTIKVGTRKTPPTPIAPTAMPDRKETTRYNA